jgi:Protein of unknown function (DUF992)
MVADVPAISPADRSGPVRIISYFFFMAALLVAATMTPAAAQSRVEAGVLECHGGGSVSFVVGSVNRFGCVFRPAEGAPQNFVATISRYGVDVGITQQSILTWVVFAPSQDVGYGSLAGRYVGASAGAVVGIGLSANALVGGSNRTFALQPLSVAGQTGLNVAAGVADLELVSEGDRYHHHHRHRHYHG